MSVFPPVNLLRLLSRETSGRALILEIDGLRFIALLLVVLHHGMGGFLYGASAAYEVPGLFGPILWAGHHGERGVQLFFTISGFILAIPFASAIVSDGPKPSLKAYYLRRITRLEPTFIINLCFAFCLYILIKGKSASEMFPHLVASIFYLHGLIYQSKSTVNWGTWSLEVEVFFYILAPFMARIFYLGNPAARMLVLLLAVFTAPFLLDPLIPEKLKGLTLGSFLHFFLLGFLFADLYLHRDTLQPDGRFKEKYSRIMSVGADVLGFAGLAVLLWVPNGQVPHQLVVLVGVALLFIGGLFGRVLRSFLSRPWIYTMGGMCYTIYLYHGFLIGYLKELVLIRTGNFYVDFILFFSVLFLTLFISSSILFICFEKPFMKKRRAAAAPQS
jgi:peptidoglycan/LPS O-acetylase OafA/YrhL